MNIGNIVYRATGIMSKKEIVRRTSNIGHDILTHIKQNENITGENIGDILSKHIGKDAKKICITTTKDECTKAIQKNLGFNEEIASQISETCLSASIPAGIKGGQTTLNLRLNDLEKELLANMSTHEIEHALYQTVSLNAKLQTGKIGKFITSVVQKILVPKKLRAKISEIANVACGQTQLFLIRDIGHFGSDGVRGWTKYQPTFEGLLKQTRCGSREELHQKIIQGLYQNGVLGKNTNPTFHKWNKICLGMLQHALKDESRAYNVGGQIQKEFYKMTHVATGKKATSSTMLSMLYDEAIIAMKNELKRIKAQGSKVDVKV